MIQTLAGVGRAVPWVTASRGPLESLLLLFCLGLCSGAAGFFMAIAEVIIVGCQKASSGGKKHTVHINIFFHKAI